MRSKMLIFAPIVQWPVHFETDLEIAQRHLDEGGEVIFLHCQGSLPVCAQNIDHRWSSCWRCTSRFAKGISWLGKERVTVKNFHWLTIVQQQLVDDLASSCFSSIKELSEITVEGADIGLAALGSVISYLKEPEPDLCKYRNLIINHMMTATTTYFSIRNHLNEENPCTFVLFNGRFAELRGALRAAQEKGTYTLVHERAGVLERYSLTCNTSPHDIGEMIQGIESIYANSPLQKAEKERIADEWFHERMSNKAQSWYSFTAQQQENLLPDLAADRLNLVIFNSSEDEMVSIVDWKNPFYTDQNEAIGLLAAELVNDRRFKLFLRVHPHLSGICNSQTNGITRLAEQFPDLTVISSHSPVSTYSLLKACDLVLTFGSTVGVEAAYVSKPSFLMGRAIYENLGCCAQPSSHAEFIDLLRRFASGDRSMLPQQAIVDAAVHRYGFFFKCWGNSYQYVFPKSVAKSLMIRNGHKTVLRPSLLSWLVDHTVVFLKKVLRYAIKVEKV